MADPKLAKQRRARPPSEDVTAAINKVIATVAALIEGELNAGLDS